MIINKRNRKKINASLLTCLFCFKNKGFHPTAVVFKRMIETDLNKNIDGNVSITYVDEAVTIKLIFADYFCIAVVLPEKECEITWYKR